jgi:transcriptional regulator with XRE-family HTH domain
MKSTYTEAYQLLLSSIEKARKKSGLTQADVANKLGKHQSYIAKIENGERRIDLIEFLEIANLISLNPHDVIQNIENLANKETDNK